MFSITNRIHFNTLILSHFLWAPQMFIGLQGTLPSNLYIRMYVFMAKLFSIRSLVNIFTRYYLVYISFDRYVRKMLKILIRTFTSFVPWLQAGLNSFHAKVRFINFQIDQRGYMFAFMFRAPFRNSFDIWKHFETRKFLKKFCFLCFIAFTYIKKLFLHIDKSWRKKKGK